MWPFGRHEKKSEDPDREQRRRFREATRALDEGREEDGIAALTELVEDYPEYVSARVNLGAAHYSAEQYEEAEREFTAALGLKPEDPRILLNLAATKSALDELDDAIDLLIRALEIDPEFRDVHYNLAIAYWRKGRIPEAVAELEMELALHPDNEPARQTMEMLKEEAGMNDEEIAPPSTN